MLTVTIKDGDEIVLIEVGDVATGEDMDERPS